jgi:hypothetical protein
MCCCCCCCCCCSPSPHPTVCPPPQNNLAKIAKWTMCALLAGADMIKLGYVSRAGEPLGLITCDLVQVCPESGVAVLQSATQSWVAHGWCYPCWQGQCYKVG